MPAPVRPEDRLFTLVLTLLSTRPGLTKAQIFESVRGYGSSKTPEELAALERKFERDKNDLRELGIPIETVESPDAPGDNTQLRYRITKSDYDLPAEIEFTPAELSLLQLAAEVWREGSVSTHSGRALLKLRSLGIETDEPILGYVPRIHTREQGFDQLSQAVTDHVAVRFDYLKPGDSRALTRTITPFALALHEGRWHVLGWDHDRGAERTFLLSRITSTVKNAKGIEPHEAPEGAQQTLLEHLADLYESSVARVRVVRGSVAEKELTHRGGTRVLADNDTSAELEVHFTDERAFAELLAGAGNEVVVVEPESLARDVAHILRRVIKNHGGLA